VAEPSESTTPTPTAPEPVVEVDSEVAPEVVSEVAPEEVSEVAPEEALNPEVASAVAEVASAEAAPADLEVALPVAPEEDIRQ